MAKLQPPHVNGEMELTEEQILEIKGKLEAIQAAFEPDDFEEFLTMQGLVARYNSANELKINGDTAGMILTYEVVGEGSAE